VKNFKSVLMGVVVSVLSISSVQAAAVVATYNTENEVSLDALGNPIYDVYIGGSGISTTYTEAGVVGTSNTYMSYTSTNVDDDGAGTRGDNLLASTWVSNSGGSDTGIVNAFITHVLGESTFNNFDFSYSNSNEDGLNFNVDSDSNPGLSILTSTDIGGIPSGGYFLLKFGGGNADRETFWLFDNTASISNFTWLTMINPLNNPENGLLGLSHFTVGSCVKNAEGVCESRTPGDDVSNVPIPAAIWLFGSALLGLTAFGSKKKAA